MRPVVPRLSEMVMGDLTRAIQMGGAAVVALVITALLSLPQGYWSVVSAIVVIQTSVGSDVVGAARDRALGTIIGAFVGGFATSFRPDGLLPLALCLGVTTTALAFLAAGRPWLKMAPVTAAILLATSTHGDGNALLALDRVLEILIGGALGIAATLILFPGRGHRVFVVASRDTAGALAALIDRVSRNQQAAGPQDDFLDLHDRVRNKLEGLAQAASGLSQGPEAQSKTDLRKALVRALWRVRNDIVLMGRSVSRPRLAVSTANDPRILLPELGQAREALKALAMGRRPPRLDAGSMAGMVAASEGLIVTDVEQLEIRLGLTHAFQNINDLADRFEERALFYGDPSRSVRA